MRLKNFRSAMSVFIAAIATACTLFCTASPAVAAPPILATSVQGGCNGTTGIVIVTLNSLTYSFFVVGSSSGSGLWVHFDATHVSQTTVNPGTFTLPSGTYNLVITTSPGTGGSSSAVYPVTVPVCAQFGSLTVKKTVLNTTGVSTPSVVFPVDVKCNPGAINTTLNLASANGYQDTVMKIPVGSKCGIQEHAIPAPAGCHWSTTYPHGQSISIAGFAGYLLPVQNELVCMSRCPKGTTEQTYPGTNIKFCCDHKLDPKSDSFCCTRERLPAPPENPLQK
jgi:uncharacterized protein DUF5979